MEKTAFIIAGHHWKDPGASGHGYKENELTIELRNLVAQRVKQLMPEGVRVWTDDDHDVLATVIRKVKQVATPNDLLLDIHFDSFTSPTASGTTALVASNARDKSKNFGADLTDILSRVMDIPNRGVKSETKSNRGRLGILHTAASSVLLEVNFISNPRDVERYQNWKHWVADEIARAILRHI